MRLIDAIKRLFGLEEDEVPPAESQPLEPRRLKAIYMGTEKIWDCNYCPNYGAKMDGESE